ncbi:MAG: hypothetical protein JWN86_1961 [Planctomycetota bacterium]|nr:hypothetical protein [Planctomycetota bacterium]
MLPREATPESPSPEADPRPGGRIADRLNSIAREQTHEERGEPDTGGRWNSAGIVALAMISLVLLVAVLTSAKAGRPVAPAPMPAGPVLTAMELMQAENGFILKNSKTARAYQANRAALAKSALAVSGLAGSVRGNNAHASALGVPQSDWVAAMDDLTLASDAFAALVANPKTTQMEAKAAYRAVTASCTACHVAFVVE